MKSGVTNFVASGLETIAVIAFLLFPLIGLIAGGGGGGFVGAIVGAMIATLIGVIIFGALFLLIQNNQTLKEIRDLLKEKQ